MGKKKYVVESEFADLHGNPDEDQDLEVDLEDSANPIIRAALGKREDDDWTPPEDEDKLEEDEEEEENSDEEEEEDEEDEESEESDNDSEEGEEDDEDDKYSKNVERRIERERQLRLKSDRRLRKMERSMELRDEKDAFNEAKHDTESKLEQLRRRKEEAVEEGDTKAQVKIDEDILDLKSELNVKKAAIERLEKELDKEPEDDRSEEDVPEPGRKWISRYPEFHSNAKFRNAVLQADKMVASQGFDTNTDEYYEKIEEIVGVTFPNIIKKRRAKIRKRPAKKGKKKKPAVRGQQRPGNKRPAKKRGRGRRVLTKEDQQQMRVFNLDPTNIEHAKEWLANKVD